MSNLKFTKDKRKLELLARVLKNAEGRETDFSCSPEFISSHPGVCGCLFAEYWKISRISLRQADRLAFSDGFSGYFLCPLEAAKDILFMLDSKDGTKWSKNVRKYLSDGGVELPEV